MRSRQSLPILLVLLLIGLPTQADEERAALLDQANASTQAAADRVKDDPSRPVFHVLPPGNWTNDPNGPIFYRGKYHLFYQHNPYGDEWGNMHWGHVESPDLVRWRHLPIALWPSESKGEKHVFSGSATIGPDGRPLIFYTSIGHPLPEQWAAIPEDDDLVFWKKHPANPILTERLHGDVRVHEWRDPFIFQNDDKTYMVLGGNLNASEGGQAVVNVYRAENHELTEWKYLGALFQHPDAKVRNIECPLFLPLGEKWLLVVSQGRPVDWFLGDLDPESMRFQPTSQGKIDFGQIYAPNVLMNDPKGRKVLWGWVDGVPAGKGWRHCLSLPRVLSLGADGQLVQEPLPELEQLRGPRHVEPGGPIPKGSRVLEDIRGDAIEIRATWKLGQAGVVGLDVLRSEDGMRSVPIRFDGQSLDVADTKVPLHLEADQPLDLRVFVDRSILEVGTADGQIWVTRVVDFHPMDQGVSLFSEGNGASLEHWESWPLKTIWKNESDR